VSFFLHRQGDGRFCGIFHVAKKLTARAIQHAHAVAMFQSQDVQRMVRLATFQPQPVFKATFRRQIKAVQRHI